MVVFLPVSDDNCPSKKKKKVDWSLAESLLERMHNEHNFTISYAPIWVRVRRRIRIRVRIRVRIRGRD